MSRERVALAILVQDADNSWRPAAQAGTAILDDDYPEWSISADDVTIIKERGHLLRDVVTKCSEVKVRFADDYGLWEGYAYIASMSSGTDTGVAIELDGSGEPQTVRIPWNMRRVHQDRKRSGRLIY